MPERTARGFRTEPAPGTPEGGGGLTRAEKLTGLTDWAGIRKGLTSQCDAEWKELGDGGLESQGVAQGRGGVYRMQRLKHLRRS